MIEPTRAGEAVAPDVVLGVPAEPDRLAATEAALALQAALRAAFPGRAGRAVLLTDDPRGAQAPGEPLPPGDEPPAVSTGGAGAVGALPALLELTAVLGAPACAILEPMPRPPGAGWLRDLLSPVLEGGFDLVAPAYRRGRFEGVLVTGAVYPLTRALFGHRVRQPLGPEIVVSRRLAEVLLRDESWHSDPLHAGQDLWVITKAIDRDCRLAQVFVGPRLVPPVQPPDLPQALARVLATAFHELELHAARWQRVRGSRPVPLFGDPAEVPGVAPPDPAPLVAAFGLGWQDLRTLWGAVLPPQTLLALQRVQREPADAFRIPDALWARVLYDFAVGWRVKAMEREQLLRSLTPLYLGWVASFVNEVAALDEAATEVRIERLCAAFEAEKPYLISRWRWPDRFSP